MTLILIVILVALVFEYINGFHDTANSIATVVSTHVLTPRQAILLAATTNLFGALVGTAVAKTIASGLVDVPAAMAQHVIMCALIGAIVWDLITWLLGLPTSSSHALIGGYAGAAVCKVGLSAITGCQGCATGWSRTLSFIVISPMIGLTAGLLLMVAIYWICRNMTPSRVGGWFRRLQLLSAAAFSLNHGANDAQKTMGIITSVLFAAGYLTVFKVPFWVVLSAHAAIGLGTLAGGWRIIHTMGGRITKLQPVHGFAAETGAASAIFTATMLGIPVSTTHAITGAIVGVGSTRRLSAVRWGVAGRIVWAWILTIPAAAVISALAYALAGRFFQG